MITNILLCIFCFIEILVILFLRKKNNKIKGLISSLEKPLRHGYYKENGTQLVFGEKLSYNSIIFVNEVDRYTNGESKIKLENIEIKASNSSIDCNCVKDFIKTCFKSIKNTSEITWLESETSIKEMRKDKLAQLKKAVKGF